jgi:hypothetical protein
LSQRGASLASEAKEGVRLAHIGEQTHYQKPGFDVGIMTAERISLLETFLLI